MIEYDQVADIVYNNFWHSIEVTGQHQIPLAIEDISLGLINHGLIKQTLTEARVLVKNAIYDSPKPDHLFPGAIDFGVHVHEMEGEYAVWTVGYPEFQQRKLHQTQLIEQIQFNLTTQGIEARYHPSVEIYERNKIAGLQPIINKFLYNSPNHRITRLMIVEDNLNNLIGAQEIIKNFWDQGSEFEFVPIWVDGNLDKNPPANIILVPTILEAISLIQTGDKVLTDFDDTSCKETKGHPYNRLQQSIFNIHQAINN
jgi:hypothetical protein